MEEVDKILILTLNQLGCDLNEDVRSVKDFGIHEVIVSVSKCLKTINGDNEFPGSLPQNMAQRFRVAATIAQAIKDTGYPGDVGYQSLLYPNEAELRKILMFLIEKLPKDTTTVSDEPINKASVIHQEVKQKLRKVLAQPWIPRHCRAVVRKFASQSSLTSYSTQNSRPFVSKQFTLESSKLSKDKKIYYEKYARRINKLLGDRYVIPTLINHHAAQLEWNNILPSSEIEKDSKEEIKLEALILRNSIEVMKTVTKVEDHQSLISTFGSYKDLMNTQEHGKEAISENSSTDVMSTEEQVTLKREEHLKQCQKEVADLTQKIQECINITESTDLSLTKLKEEIEMEDKLNDEKTSELKTKQRTASLIPDSESNIKKLQATIKNSEEKMTRLQQQWEAHKEPLEEQLEKLTHEISGRKGNEEHLRNRLSELRDKMRSMVQDAPRKEVLLTQLKTQCENMNKDINRSVYTKRIIDISSKVRKQKEEIDRVLADTRTIQKEINTISGKLERTFTVVESLAFKEASSNERARQIYRAVAAVHEGCGDLVDTIRETGAIQRDISDLKEQVDLEKDKKVEETLEQLKTDLSQVKKENAALKQQLS
ncbi:coiled-coil domain-containing protein 22 homolog [Palaemon carinicauda]|uniref:coiled-coil domain-containing protein 22 homolog n=1 Tax=Palaemon carinicauda TaxID=392227 RepID=UPI0035B69AF1